MDSYDHVAITPIDHGVFIKPDALTELILKKQTHLYRLRRTRNPNASPNGKNHGSGRGPSRNNETAYELEHRFESMASWNWVATYVDPATALASLFSTFGFSFGTIKDGNVVEAESFIGPSGNITSDTGELWFEPTENTAVFVTNPKHLPIGFGQKGQQGEHYELAFMQDSGNISVGYRPNFEEQWQMVDKVESGIQDSIKALCELSGLKVASPPTHSEIETVWDSASPDDGTREFQ